MPARLGREAALVSSDSDDRRRFYAMMLTLGRAEDIIKYIDGALLVDLWSDIELPRPVRAAWDPIVRAGARGPTGSQW